MEIKKLILLCMLLISSAVAYPKYGNEHSRNHNLYDEPTGPAKYSFKYGVEDSYYGSNFGHQETRDYDKTEGSYYVLLPDGRTQKVTYYVNGNSGYVAHVSYIGEAHHPEPKSYKKEYH